VGAPNKAAGRELQALVEANPITRGLVVRSHGSHLILSRDVQGPDGETERDDRVRLTELGGSCYGLSVRRHTGRWEKTPFSGSLQELSEVMCATMQHIVADWP